MMIANSRLISWVFTLLIFFHLKKWPWIIMKNDAMEICGFFLKSQLKKYLDVSGVFHDMPVSFKPRDLLLHELLNTTYSLCERLGSSFLASFFNKNYRTHWRDFDLGPDVKVTTRKQLYRLLENYTNVKVVKQNRLTFHRNHLARWQWPGCD